MGISAVLLVSGIVGWVILTWAAWRVFSYLGIQIFGPYPSGPMVGSLRIFGLLALSASTGLAVGLSFENGRKPLGIGILLIAIPFILYRIFRLIMYI
jgi:hypothetical protein